MQKITLFISALILCHFAMFANTYHVKNGGSDSNNGLSFANAFLTLQKASNTVAAGDTVLVYDGTYTGFNHNGSASGTSGNSIVFWANGNNVWIRQGSNIGDGINIENADWIEIHGFNVKVPNNTSIGGGEEGIRAVLADHITIKNNFCDSNYRGILTGYTDYITIENNTCTRSYGEHGIYVSNNSDYVTLRYNSCSYNKASGMQINPDLSSGAPGYSKHILVSNNKAFENKGAAGFNFQGIDSALIMNNLIYNNHNASGITLYHGDASVGCTNVKVYNNTILVPSDGRWGIHVIDDASNIDIKNNIIINLHSWKGVIALQANTFTQTNIKSNYNVVSDKFCDIDDGCTKTLATWQGYGYDANSILAPSNLASLFVNAGSNDYHLASGAVAINAGTSTVSADVTKDYDMNNRPFGAGYDMGCYEFGATNLFDQLRTENKYIALQNGSTITFTNIEADHIVEVFDMGGKLIGKGRSFTSTTFAKGMYIFNVVSQNDNLRVGSGKFVINSTE